MINTYVNCRKVLIRMTNRSLICLETFYFLYCLFTKVWLKMNVATHALNELSCSTAHSLNCNLQKQRQHMGAIIIHKNVLSQNSLSNSLPYNINFLQWYNCGFLTIISFFYFKIKIHTSKITIIFVGFTIELFLC